MYKHKMFAVAVNILPIHQSIYTVNALALTRLLAPLCNAVAMALTSPCMHKCCSGIGTNNASEIDKWTRFHSNCYQKSAERNCNGWIHCNLCWSWNTNHSWNKNPKFSKSKLSQCCKEKKITKWMTSNGHMWPDILTAQMHPPNINHWLRKKMPILPNVLNKNI